MAQLFDLVLRGLAWLGLELLGMCDSKVESASAFVTYPSLGSGLQLGAWRAGPVRNRDRFGPGLGRGSEAAKGMEMGCGEFLRIHSPHHTSVGCGGYNDERS